MKSAKICALSAQQIERVIGGVGGIPDDPTIEDLIDLADEFDAITRWRLGIPD